MANHRYQTFFMVATPGFEHGLAQLPSATSGRFVQPGCCYDQDQGERSASSWWKRDASTGVRSTLREALEGGPLQHSVRMKSIEYLECLSLTCVELGQSGNARSPID